MEENVALDSSKQKKFDKSIKGIKKIIKKKDAEPKVKGDGSKPIKSGRISKKKRKERGLVYLSHIPHGFYENEMSQYFKQFGVVTNARVIKSKKTGHSKGYAFVEFKETAVAQIVAETMNNYLMGKRLIKAAYIPPEKQKRKVFRKRWNAVNNPGNNLRLKIKKAHNENKNEEGELQRARKLVSNINKTKKKLSKLGINYDFFTPVDVPEALTKTALIKIDNEEHKIVDNKQSKKKGKQVDGLNLNVKKEIPKDTKKKTKSCGNIEVKEEQNKNKIKNEKRNKYQQVEEDNITQEQKKQNMKNKGVAPLEDFIKIGKESNDESDSSSEFNLDEFEKMLEDDDAVDSDIVEDSENEDNSGSDKEDETDKSEEKQLPKWKGANKPTLVVPVKKSKYEEKKSTQKKPQPQQAKRRAPPKAPITKKPKFEKQSNQKPRNKQFKKKK